MKLHYDLHKDFRFVRFISAPVRPLKVLLYNFVNMKVIEGISKEAILPAKHYSIKSRDGNEVDVMVVRPENYVNVQDKKRWKAKREKKISQESEERVEKKKKPCLIYYHGGGFRTKVVLPQFTRIMEYAKELDCVVVMPDYRLIPQNPYPKGFEDTYATLDFVADYSEKLGIDIDRVIVLGDSAGGKLAASVALKARDENHRIKPLAMFLIYPVTDCLQLSKSIQEFRFAPIWNSAKNRKMWKQYLKNGVEEEMEYASPLYAKSMKGLPKTFIEVAEFDCLRDEGIQLYKRIKKEGGKAKLLFVHKAVHGYDSFFLSEYVNKIVEKRMKEMKKVFEERNNG